MMGREEERREGEREVEKGGRERGSGEEGNNIKKEKYDLLNVHLLFDEDESRRKQRRMKKGRR